MGKFINPFTDYGFKKIFGQEVSKELLIEFLNDLLEGERVITDLTFLNNEQLTCSVLSFPCHCPSGREGRELEVRYKSGVRSLLHQFPVGREP